MKKIKHISFLYASLFIILSYFLYIAYWANPGYDIETPYVVANNTADAVELIIYFIDEFDKQTLVKHETIPLMPQEEKILAHPDYENLKNQKIFIELEKNGKVIYTYSTQLKGKHSKFQIIDDPLRIIDTFSPYYNINN